MIIAPTLLSGMILIKTFLIYDDMSDYNLDHMFSILVLLLSSLDALLVFLTERQIEASSEKPKDKKRSKSGKKTSAPPIQPV